jgi:hypothetical protein
MGAESIELRLALGKREVREDCWKQPFEELVIVDGPCNPETETAHPEQGIFHVELHARV